MRSVPRCDPRWLCLLPPLLLLTEVSLGAAAAAALKRRDKLDPLEPTGDTEHYYKKCPAGQHAERHCEEGKCFTKCLPCNESEFTEYPNDFPKCLRCQVCREDQVELSPCQATRNTQCACRNGTFCSPDHPCEMCQKCRPRCPKGEVELAACTPHSDRRCGPPTAASSGSSINLPLILGVVLLLGLLVLLLVCWKCCCQRSGDGRDLRRKSCSMVDYLWQQLRRVGSRDLETRDNDQNERQDKLLPGAPTSGTANVPRPEVAVPRTTDAPRQTLVPAQGRDPVMALRRSFDIFAEVVPLSHWKRYCRALDLLENDIDLAEKNDKYSREWFFQMLTTWHNKQGMSASVNTLLDTLHQLSLGGVARDISARLIKQGLFQHEGS
ncbi:tumor necrosis factor receptor superfamily member 10A-like [Pogoniulus pusillus]|uniref:tumor necrosis factor receptor superfamily member 10A-like n=1 Tax=Pogoniulus pusillus TaxID=488313 RepID=UPI0030B94C97